MADEIKKVIIEIDGTSYEIAGGGGTPAPNSVDSSTIKDGSVQIDDLHDDVKQKIQKTYDEDDETMFMDFDESDVNGSQNND